MEISVRQYVLGEPPKCILEVDSRVIRHGLGEG